jgi:hypothetical protein
MRTTINTTVGTSRYKELVVKINYLLVIMIISSWMKNILFIMMMGSLNFMKIMVLK